MKCSRDIDNASNDVGVVYRRWCCFDAHCLVAVCSELTATDIHIVLYTEGENVFTEGWSHKVKSIEFMDCNFGNKSLSGFGKPCEIQRGI